jgi:hypothetical protein
MGVRASAFTSPRSPIQMLRMNINGRKGHPSSGHLQLAVFSTWHVLPRFLQPTTRRGPNQVPSKYAIETFVRNYLVMARCRLLGDYQGFERTQTR